MDNLKAWAEWLSEEIDLTQHVSFWLVVGVVGIVVWRVLEWRYRAIIQRSQDECAHLQRHLDRNRQTADTMSAVHAPEHLPSQQPEPESQLPSVFSLSLSESTPQNLGEDVFLPDTITPAFLFAECKGKTQIECDRAIASFVGKRIKVRGEVVAASKVWGSTTVSVVPEGDDEHRPTDIHLTFEEEQERVGAMSKGEFLAASGRIVTVDEFGMRLVYCQLLD